MQWARSSRTKNNKVIIESNLHLLLEIVCVFKGFGVHNNTSIECAVEKLYKIPREKEA
jgi:hypothetical protein